MGTNLILIKVDGTEVPLQNRQTITRITSAKQTWALNADDKVNITIETTTPQSYDIGDRVVVFGRVYKMNRLPKVKRDGGHSFTYDLEFEGVQYDLLRVTYDLTIDTTNNALQDVSGDSLTGDLRRFMTVLVSNANRVFPNKWALGECPDTVADKTLTFGESDNCLLVLQTLCGESNFNVEFEIVYTDGVYIINLKQRVGSTLPYTFHYGKGLGLYELTRDNVSTANLVTRLKVYGSTENITLKYRADRLCLPNKTKGQSYIEKPEAVAKYGIFEGRKDFDVKPTFTGEVKQLISGDVLSFIDDTFPFDINAKNEQGETLYLIAGVEAKIHFITGNLAGYDFSVKSYDHATHTFVINKFTDDRGDVFPSATSIAFQFAKGDKYKITDIAYSEDIEQEAERELERQADEYYDQNSQPKVQYSLAVTKEWLETLVNATDEGIYNVFMPGDYLHIVDEEIGVDKSVRIKSFVRNVLDYYDYSLTISDTTVTTTITNNVLSDLIDIDKILTVNNLKDPTRARANWRSSRELLEMVFDPEGDYYTDKIKPNSIDTLMLSVGAKSMQFNLTNTVFQPNYGGQKNVLSWKGGVLTHYTINEETAMYWNLADGTFTASNDTDAFYIYAKCSRSSDVGMIEVTTQQHKVDDNANYWYFWIGVLNSVDIELNARTIALTYGFTTVNGRFIKTGRISSADGETFFDLDDGVISGRIMFQSKDGTGKDVSDLEDAIDNIESGGMPGGANMYAGEDINETLTTTGTKTYALFVNLGTAEQGKTYVASYQSCNLPNTTCIVLAKSKPSVYYDSSTRKNTLSKTIDGVFDWGEKIPVTSGTSKVYAVCGLSSASLKSLIANPIMSSIFISQLDTYTISKIMLQQGEIATGYIPYNAPIEYLTNALKDAAKEGVTTVEGGLLNTNLILMQDPDSDTITAGISGIKLDKVLFFGGATYEEAQEAANGTKRIPFLIKRDGTGNIGVFDVKEDEITVTLGNDKIRISTDDGIEIYQGDQQKIIVTNKQIGSWKPTALTNQSFTNTMDINDTGSFGSGYSTYGANNFMTFTLAKKSTVTFNLDSAAEVGPVYSGDNFQDSNNWKMLPTLFGIFVDDTNNMLWNGAHSATTGIYYATHTVTINKTLTLEAGTHKIYCMTYYDARGSSSNYGFNCSSRVIGSKSLKVSAVPIDETKPITVMGIDGFISVKNASQYFMVRNESSRQRIITSGLSTTKGTDGSGELYVSSNFIESFKLLCDELSKLCDSIRYEGYNTAVANKAKEQLRTVKQALSDNNLIASS